MSCIIYTRGRVYRDIVQLHVWTNEVNVTWSARSARYIRSDAEVKKLLVHFRHEADVCAPVPGRVARAAADVRSRRSAQMLL